MKISAVVALVACVVTAAGCERTGQNTYNYNEVGRTGTIQFGTVISVREVNVKGQNTGAGAVVGAAGGGIAGNQMGHGGGNALATLGGVIVGAAAGALAEQAIADRTATEYILTLESGTTVTIVQDHTSGDQPINPGDRVVLQTSGGKQRVLPAAALPTEVKRPQGIKVTD